MVHRAQLRKQESAMGVSLALACAILSSAAAAPTTAAATGNLKQRPNIVFIVIDDLGWDDVGFRSHEIRTPTIDALASKGRVLEQYYVQDVCSPSRATFMTGRFAMHHSIVDWIPPASAYGLPLNETTMADKMQEAGYACHATGKWHLGFYKWGMTPTFRGFDSFVGFYSGGEGYFSHVSGGAYDFRRDPSPRCGPGCSKVAAQDNNAYSTTVFTTEAVRVVDAHAFEPAAAARPLFLYLAYQGVHSPAQVPQRYIDAYNTSISEPKRRTFAGMLSAVDEGISNVSRALAGRGPHVLANTLFVFTADNGGPTTTGDGVGARNWPLRGGKHSVWEGGTRATSFISGAGITPSTDGNNLFLGLMHGADWLSTLSTVAGYGLNGTLPLDGVDQWKFLASQPVASGPWRSAPSARTALVIGNSTNMCSWDATDPRYHPLAALSNAGADLPAGALGALGGGAAGGKGKLGCGFATRRNVGAHKWKLIQGYGGGPDTWCNSTQHKPNSCAPNGPPQLASTPTCSAYKNTCFPGNDIRNFPCASTSDCCAACLKESGCKFWTLNKQNVSCFLKTHAHKSEKCSGDSGATPGNAPPAPGPGPAPSPGPHEPVSACPGGWCLYDVALDPYEQHEISAANPNVVKSMQTEMAEVLQSYTEYQLDLSCPKQTFVTDPVVGKSWQPWCGVD